MTEGCVTSADLKAAVEKAKKVLEDCKNFENSHDFVRIKTSPSSYIKVEKEKYLKNKEKYEKLRYKP